MVSSFARSDYGSACWQQPGSWELQLGRRCAALETGGGGGGVAVDAQEMMDVSTRRVDPGALLSLAEWRRTWSGITVLDCNAVDSQ